MIALKDVEIDLLRRLAQITIQYANHAWHVLIVSTTPTTLGSGTNDDLEKAYLEARTQFDSQIRGPKAPADAT
jgi:hypothetical protein